MSKSARQNFINRQKDLREAEITRLEDEAARKQQMREAEVKDTLQHTELEQLQQMLATANKNQQGDQILESRRQKQNLTDATERLIAERTAQASFADAGGMANAGASVDDLRHDAFDAASLDAPPLNLNDDRMSRPHTAGLSRLDIYSSNVDGERQQNRRNIERQQVGLLDGIMKLRSKVASSAKDEWHGTNGKPV